MKLKLNDHVSLKIKVLGLGLCLAVSCKAVKSGKHDNGLDVGPQVETGGNGTPAVPGATTPGTTVPVVPGTPVDSGTGMNGGNASPAAQVVYLPDPALPEVATAVAKPDAMQVFSIRSIPIGQSGIPTRQYRIDLPNKKVSLDKLTGDAWEQTTQYALTDDQIAKVKASLAAVKSGVYPSCNPCKRDVHLLVLETVEDNKKAMSYAMSEPCTCGGNDERKATLPYASLKTIADLLNR